MDEEKQLQYHHEFIVSSDRKSLFTQIKNLVARAQDIANKELSERRIALQKLIEYEDKIYEEEFASKVKSRIDEDIKERKDALLKIKEESAKHELEFLKSKRIQQYMNSCYEIREALRRQEMQNVQICQLEQIVEKERAIKRERDLEKYWRNVQKTRLDREDCLLREESCLKKALAKDITETLNIQMEEREEKREELHREKLEEKRKLDALLEEIRLEEFDARLQGTPVKTLEYRKELLNMIAENKARKEKEKREAVEYQCKMTEEIQRLEAADILAAHERKRAFYKATIEYIAYVKRMKQLEEQQERMYNDRVDDLSRVDTCTKSNIKRERERKARVAEACYAELRKQICEQYERRLRDEAEHRECKMLENRFAHEEITREQILEQRRKNRIGLDQQIAELKRIREDEEAKFSKDIKRASNDPEFCAELAEQYIKDGTDYLEPHPNWRILACPTKTYIAKSPAKDFTELTGQGDKCIAPCGCEARAKMNCIHKQLDGRGDQANSQVNNALTSKVISLSEVNSKNTEALKMVDKPPPKKKKKSGVNSYIIITLQKNS
uniref:Trichohyalin-plectin-homology domain-containing protein n=1 Tax=Glossina pallidipes TaxID=7398 RepID=A0A1B0ACN6_GLOPL